MSTENKLKSRYTPPVILCVKLDNEISLALASDPIEGPDEGSNLPGNLNNSPYKSNLG